MKTNSKEMVPLHHYYKMFDEIFNNKLRFSAEYISFKEIIIKYHNSLKRKLNFSNNWLRRYRTLSTIKPRQSIEKYIELYNEHFKLPIPLPEVDFLLFLVFRTIFHHQQCIFDV